MTSIQMLRSALPRAPFDLQEAIELYAREGGRTAKLHFMPGGGWFARFSLRCNDKRMQLFQQGMAEEPPSEDVWFHVPNPREQDGLTLTELKAMEIPVLWSVVRMENGRCRMPFLPLDVEQMGASGVRTFLEKGNLWSGRGEFGSLEQQLREVRDKNERAKEKHREDLKEENRRAVRDERRWRFKLPFVPVGIDLRGKGGK